MGLDDLVNKGKELFEQNKDRIHDALKSEKAENVSDAALDKAADAAKGVLPDNLDARIDGVRDDIDGAVGDK